MIAIESIALREIRLPLVQPFRSATGEVTGRRVILAELVDGDGLSAWSECVAPDLPTYGPDTVDSCWLAITEWLGHRLKGARFVEPVQAYHALARDIRGHRMAIAALEMGVWALAAVREGLPLATLLSRYAQPGCASPKPCVADDSLTPPATDSARPGLPPRETVASGIAIGMQGDTDAFARAAREAVSTGYKRIRIKIAPERDVQFVRAVLHEAGQSIPVIADANGSYDLSEPGHAAALAELDGLGLHMLEQPLAHDEYISLARLQRELRTSICLDESVCSPADARTMLELGCARALNLKPARVGGLACALDIHNELAGRAVPMWCGGMLESGVGRAFNVALAALPGFTEPGDLSPSARYWQRDIVLPEWTMDSSGEVQIPLDTPGIGVEVDRDFVDSITFREAVL